MFLLEREFNKCCVRYSLGIFIKWSMFEDKNSSFSLISISKVSSFRRLFNSIGGYISYFCHFVSCIINSLYNQFIVKREEYAIYNK
jgi:hypothetical protein